MLYFFISVILFNNFSFIFSFSSDVSLSKISLKCWILFFVIFFHLYLLDNNESSISDLLSPVSKINSFNNSIKRCYFIINLIKCF